MLFNSVVFFLFLPAVFALHFAVRDRRWQNAVLLIASYIFYGFWDYRFCGLLLGTSLLDYWSGLRIDSTPDRRRKKLFLAISLAGNLGVLGFYKYFNFFADSMAMLFAAVGLDINTTSLNIILPVGISFYTFQTLSYSIDIYRGHFKPKRDLLQYMAFVSFFPQLVAGPIERAKDLLPQFSSTRTFSHDAAIDGCRLMLWGFLKKMVLADNLGVIVNNTFAQSGASSAQLALATFCFAFQIYGDFSGYSDIAAGVASLFSIRLRRNFAYPYFSQSLSEFWHRWHISLSTWFRDYVFIPLGGSRGTSRRTARNILLTMLISGLWHGAAWHFVAWGFLHGGLLAASRLTLRNRVSRASGPDNPPAPQTSLIPSAIILMRILRTFAIICVGWIFFRADTLGRAIEIIAHIIEGLFTTTFYVELVSLVAENRTVLLLVTAFNVVEWCGRERWNPLPIARWPTPVRWVAYTAAAWTILLLGTRHVAEFIYFQF